ncbi:MULTISPECIES: antA/AntB antirepressor family protein [unclassified Halomonas]|uniref:antA/AntB antirepressor family protein n=1 Tax=Halomonas TaxID=2745 RepID=UPI001C97814B|nr:antA/AntB antirepressor family protein [Halomonas sp. DP3Y7-2]MBY6227253.1 antA/AntB antirepressor family protein [Halomonas sp. DP3Y7-1]MCA0914997.1 antA/AntB antirepressor family protein [Halomonas denitrificans]
MAIHRLCRRITEYGFTKDQDFYSELSKTPSGGRPSREYHLSLDMAKELFMVERNEGLSHNPHWGTCKKPKAITAPIPPRSISSRAIRAAVTATWSSPSYAAS